MQVTTEHKKRFRLIGTDRDDDHQVFADDVRAGLTAHPKQIPPWYLYDRQGSALFEQICAQPEYYLTQVEWRILKDYGDEIVAHLPAGVALVELGAGSAVKTRTIIDAVLRREQSLHFLPVAVSQSALTDSADRLLSALPRLRITAMAAEYDDGLRFAEDHIDGPKCLLWLGSSVGNLTRPDAADFLSRLSETLGAEDRLLVGVDMRKDACVIRAAYNDAAGVSSRFNANMFARINRELGGQFDSAAFRYRAEYDIDAGRVDMMQVSRRPQEVRIEDLDLDVSFDQDEPVHFESSHKYSQGEIDALAGAANLSCLRRWYDDRHYFSVNIFARNGDSIGRVKS